MTTYSTLKTQLSDNGIFQITLHRPEKLNALNKELVAELDDIIQKAKQDDRIKALLVTGEGKAFCAGADIQQFDALSPIEALEFAKYGQKVFRSLEQLGKPSLAAVNGYAFGGGCELAISCSMRIASNNAQFGQPEVKLGIIPGYGGTQRLARLIGKGRAIDLCITGRSISANDALQFGLLSEVTTPEELLNRAHAILQTILAMGPVAVASVLEVIDRGYDLSLDDAIALEASHFSICCSTKDKSEGAKAFLEKRKANFVGK